MNLSTYKRTESLDHSQLLGVSQKKVIFTEFNF